MAESKSNFDWIIYLFVAIKSKFDWDSAHAHFHFLANTFLNVNFVFLIKVPFSELSSLETLKPSTHLQINAVTKNVTRKALEHLIIDCVID